MIEGKIKLYNIIGDIHGKDCWKELIKEDAVNIFVGDYFSPYNAEKYTYEICMKNFLEIVHYARLHKDNVVLLIGNHDADHWQWRNSAYHTRAYDAEHADEIMNAFEENKDLFKIAYSIENKILVTHAGVSALWLYRMMNIDYMYTHRFGISDYNDLSAPAYKKFNNIEDAWKDKENYISEWSHGDYTPLEPKEFTISFFNNNWYYFENSKWNKLTIDPDTAVKIIENAWEKDPHLFSWKANASMSDTWGDSVTQSPLWIRAMELIESNIFRGSKEYHQIVGHTQFKAISTHSYETDDREMKEIVFVDCLQYNEMSFPIYVLEKNRKNSKNLLR